MAAFTNRFLFPAPPPTYNADHFNDNLCWVPWNPAVGPLAKYVALHHPENADGIPCLWFPAERAATVVMFLHGNAEDLGLCYPFLRHMRDQFKVNVLSCEYPAYGLLKNLSPSPDAVNEVVTTVLRYLVDTVGVAYPQIFFFGRSIGSGPAVHVASRYPVGGLILVSPFTSIRDAVKSIVGPIPSLFFQDRFVNSKLIQNVSCPTLFIHGECDYLIPLSHSEELHSRCRSKKLLVCPPHMEHNSNLFCDAEFLAIPVINFFGFPGYAIDNPPRLPEHIFRAGKKQVKLTVDPSSFVPWVCRNGKRMQNDEFEVPLRHSSKSVSSQHPSVSCEAMRFPPCPPQPPCNHLTHEGEEDFSGEFDRLVSSDSLASDWDDILPVEEERDSAHIPGDSGQYAHRRAVCSYPDGNGKGLGGDVLPRPPTGSNMSDALTRNDSNADRIRDEDSFNSLDFWEGDLHTPEEASLRQSLPPSAPPKRFQEATSISWPPSRRQKLSPKNAPVNTSLLVDDVFLPPSRSLPEPLRQPSLCPQRRFSPPPSVSLASSDSVDEAVWADVVLAGHIGARNVPRRVR
ncbi:unnamed protein product [Vitrella brassicaformis CCMP3155]|uniref:Serine aminopeptidase S33 domain-containing protein n=2 Tax=Vitrella brassicaformis TaxID=1169539 RepID=A0A0G4FLJ9_VITBC|nr:unnamed protein product [Vitrella brassicaformis CCMP3155]|eukprot:CEM14886.1 unnamed protein product [Vitrella brassicaformis CCMP3155]